SQQYKNWNSF
nr:immunoglobulin light chain junction region [Macaca mulatta]